MRVVEVIEPPHWYAVGGILINDKKQTLLREPSDHYEGYVWTFAKGGIDSGENLETAAIREVYEETGYRAEIIEKIPKLFRTRNTTTLFYLMKPVGRHSKFGWETQSVKWVSLDEADSYIAQTKNEGGKRRDMEILQHLKTMPQFEYETI